MVEYKLVRCRVVYEKLVPFGFELIDGTYVYTETILDGQFLMMVVVADDVTLRPTVIDMTSGEEYVLHLVSGSAGGFVGRVRAEYDRILQEICDRCGESEIFHSDMAKRLIGYVRGQYGDELEFLWDKFPDNAVWRRSDSRKWYAAILTVSRRKLGLPSDDVAEVIDLRLPPEQMAALIDNERYFPGWHMNKRHWYTVILDGSVSFEALCQRIDESYRLAAK